MDHTRSSQEAAAGIVEKLGDKHPTSYLDLLGARCKEGQRESNRPFAKQNLRLSQQRSIFFRDVVFTCLGLSWFIPLTSCPCGGEAVHEVCPRSTTGA